MPVSINRRHKIANMCGRAETWKSIWARALLCAGLFVPSQALAGPITFNTALPVHSGEVIVREQVVIKHASSESSTLTVVAVPSVLVYGIHSRVTAFAILPYVNKSITNQTREGPLTMSAGGFGDLTTLLRVTALAINRPGSTIRLAPFVGLKLPTGATESGDGVGGSAPRPLQPGTGSWDPIAGAILTWQTLGWELDMSTSYQLKTAADGYEVGDEVRGEASFQYRVVPWGDLGSGVPSYIFALVETNAIWRAKDARDGQSQDSTGGFTWFVGPGLQWVTQRTVLEAAVQLPVYQELGGQLETDFVARLSFRINF